MTRKRMVIEMGMGTDIRGKDYTKAACRALKDALWHNSLGIADIMGVDVDSMCNNILAFPAMRHWRRAQHSQSSCHCIPLPNLPQL